MVSFGVQRKDCHQGFTLVELMIVVAIIAVLAALAIPSFFNYMIKSKRSEAFLGLASLYKSEISFYAEHDYFTPSLAQLGFSLGQGPTLSNGNCMEGSLIACGKHYHLKIQVWSATSFGAQALGWPDPNAGVDEFLVLYPDP